MKAGCVAVVVAAVLVLAVLMGAGGYWYYTTTPTYSVKQIESALKARDTERFETYVDLDALLGNAYDQFTRLEDEDEAGGGKRDPGSWGDFGRLLGASLLKPQIVGWLKRQVLEAVTSGRLPASETVSARPTFAGLDYVRREGQTAQVGLKVEESGSTYVLALRLRRNGWRWRLIAIENLAQIAEQYRRKRADTRPPKS